MCYLTIWSVETHASGTGIEAPASTSFTRKSSSRFPSLEAEGKDVSLLYLWKELALMT